MEMLSNECFDLINGFFGNEPKLKLTISDVLALHTNDWLNCVFLYLQSQVTEKKGYAPTKQSKLTSSQYELWLLLFGANLPR
jgi:hypothetical protein